MKEGLRHDTLVDVIARMLMVAGGLGLVVAAWMPAYLVFPKPVFGHVPGGGITIRGLPAQALSPRDLAMDRGVIVGVILLLPHFFGLSIVVAQLFEPVARRLGWLYQAIAVITILPAAVGTFVLAIMALFGGLFGLGWGPCVAAGLSAAALGLVLGATMRTMNPATTARASARLRSLLHQGASCFLACGWLVLAAAMAEKAMPIHAVAMPALALVLVGTHLAARAELAAI